MAIQKIELGTEPHGVGGDSYRTANEKINRNFEEVGKDIKDVSDSNLETLDKLSEEVLRAKAAESNLQSSIDEETSRSVGVELNLSNSITKEVSDRESEVTRLDEADAVLQAQINSVGGGKLAYKTYAEMIADESNIAAKSSIDIIADTDDKNGTYLYDGTNFVKSQYDLEKIIRAKVQNTFGTYAQMVTSNLSDGAYALVADDTVDKNGLYVKDGGNWTKSSYDTISVASDMIEQSRKRGSNLVPLIWFYRPKFEHGGGSLYMKPTASAGNILYVDDKRFGGRWNLKTEDWDSFLSENSLTLEKSPSGEEGFLKAPRGIIIALDTVNRKLVLKNSLNIGDNIPLVFDDYGVVGRCVEEANIRTQLAEKKALSSDSQTNSRITDLDNNIKDRIAYAGKDYIEVLNSWMRAPYYEVARTSVNYFYFKPRVDNPTPSELAFYIYDRRYPYFTKTVADIYQAVTDYCERRSKNYEDIVKTSPKGVEDCIYFSGDRMLVLDLVTQELVFDDRNNLMKTVYPNPVSIVLSANYADWGRGSEELNLRDSYTQDLIKESYDSVLSAANIMPDIGIKSVAHRGLSDIYPENTLVAFRGAKKAGFKYVECDVYPLADGNMVLHHDTDLGRIIPLEGDIRQRTYDELKDFDVGSWKDPKFSSERIPTIEEFLDLCRILGLHPYIETKGFDRDQSRDLVDRVENAGLQGKVTYISNNINSLLAIVGKDPSARVGYVRNPSVDIVDEAVTKQLYTGQNEVFMDFAYSGLTKEVVDYSISKGFDVEAWTINQDHHALIAINMGVRGITTDKLDMRAVIKGSYLDDL